MARGAVRCSNMPCGGYSVQVPAPLGAFQAWSYVCLEGIEPVTRLVGKPLMNPRSCHNNGKITMYCIQAER